MRTAKKTGAGPLKGIAAGPPAAKIQIGVGQGSSLDRNGRPPDRRTVPASAAPTRAVVVSGQFVASARAGANAQAGARIAATATRTPTPARVTGGVTVAVTLPAAMVTAAMSRPARSRARKPVRRCAPDRPAAGSTTRVTGRARTGTSSPTLTTGRKWPRIGRSLPRPAPRSQRSGPLRSLAPRRRHQAGPQPLLLAPRQAEVPDRGLPWMRGMATSQIERPFGCLCVVHRNLPLRGAAATS